MITINMTLAARQSALLLPFKSRVAQTSIMQSALVTVQTRGYLPYYQDKYKRYFKPQYYDNPQRQPQSIGKVKYNTQDPLYFDYRHEHINGGIQLVRLPCSLMVILDGRSH